VWLLAAFTIGSLVWLIMVMIPSLDRTRMASAAKPTDPARPPGSFVRDLFIPTPKLYGLPILIDTNIVGFLVMALSGLGVMSFDRDDLLVWGANFRPAIHGIGMFRLITSQFVHGGLIHLANNLYGLLFAGMFLTPVALNGRLIASYLLCGLGGSIASVSTSRNSECGCVGRNLRPVRNIVDARAVWGCSPSRGEEVHFHQCRDIC
jgi:membrane associated rhomboid family serine protease